MYFLSKNLHYEDIITLCDIIIFFLRPPYSARSLDISSQAQDHSLPLQWLQQSILHRCPHEVTLLVGSEVFSSSSLIVIYFHCISLTLRSCHAVVHVNFCDLYRYHLKQRFPCDECGQTFSTESYMYKHRRTHSG